MRALSAVQDKQRVIGFSKFRSQKIDRNTTINLDLVSIKIRWVYEFIPNTLGTTHRADR